MKLCNKCNNLKPFTMFHVDKNMRDGFKNQCKDCKSIYSKQHNSKPSVRDRNKQIKRAYYIKNSEHEKEYRTRNRDRIIGLQRKWLDKNKKYVYKKNAEYSKNRIKTDILFKIRVRVRARLSNAIRDNIKTGSAVSDLGCSITHLKIKLQLKFHRNPATGEYMTWENYGPKGWHIDHIIPLASFDLSDPEQFKKAVHYSNLQPLWAKDNLKKSDT